jgi:hypothetical protein
VATWRGPPSAIAGDGQQALNGIRASEAAHRAASQAEFTGDR